MGNVKNERPLLRSFGWPKIVREMCKMIFTGIAFSVNLYSFRYLKQSSSVAALSF
jgi:hypothetical protein